MKDLNVEPGSGTGQGSFFSYTTGLVLALVLSAIAFATVMLRPFSPPVILPVILAAAIAQVVVHLVFFLHMNRASTPRWNIIVFAFAMVVITILIGGSIWIMFTANGQMMPMGMGE
jgi:cytochrome o ubiquinol oxidase operon protein cyoD